MLYLCGGEFRQVVLSIIQLFQYLPYSGSSKGVFPASVTYIYVMNPSWTSHQIPDKQPATLTFASLTTLEFPVQLVFRQAGES